MGTLAQSGIDLCAEHWTKVQATKRITSPEPVGIDHEMFRSGEEIGEIQKWIESKQPLVGGPIPVTVWSVPCRDYGPRELDEREREYDRGWERRQDLMPMPDRRTRRG